MLDKDFAKRAREKGGGVIVGGENYGQGSSREHAALAPRYLGVTAKLVKSIARIHKANLINFGIVPLTFKNPADYDAIEQGAVIAIPGIRKLIADGAEEIPVEIGGKKIVALLDVMKYVYDAIIVGAGGAGLYAALEASAGAKTAVLSKLHPLRSHTGAAQGGIGAALGNLEEDKPEWHAFDTIKGGDYLADQNAVKILVEGAVEAVYHLENMGLPFSRTADGKIDQRRFGGHTRNFGEAPVMRACYAADRTGHMILQTLYQQCIKNGVHFFDEYIVMEVLIENGKCNGLVVLELATGELHTFQAKAVLFATGGFGRMYKTTSNAYANTGDGPALLARAGVPLMDMEFFQFHPTGIYGMGILITEAVRGEGGILLNRNGERFMEEYAPRRGSAARR